MTAATQDALSNDIILTKDQQKAFQAFSKFVTDPSEQVFVLRGYSGCGKSTLVKYILDQLPKINKMMRLLNPAHTELAIELTATTNKAAESLSFLTGAPVSTIHSFLGLRMETHHITREKRMVPSGAEAKVNRFIVIDEASYIDRHLLQWIFKLTQNCKFMFIGDPAQLAPVKASTTPVFEADWPGAALTQVVRQAEGNPIVDLSTMLRNTVNTGVWNNFTPDQEHIRVVPRNVFDEEIVKEFTRDGWKYRDSKILAFTNKRCVDYNKAIKQRVQGDPQFVEGDNAICNKYIAVNRRMLKTDQLVQITEKSEDCERHDVLGNMFTIDGFLEAFMPKSLSAKRERLRQAKADQDYHIVAEIEEKWIDLRAAYACTINKAQGSTFDRVYIDLDDIRTCTSGDQIARMLYVAVSRARHQVFLTGDIA